MYVFYPFNHRDQVLLGFLFLKLVCCVGLAVPMFILVALFFSFLSFLAVVLVIRFICFLVRRGFSLVFLLVVGVILLGQVLESLLELLDSSFIIYQDEDLLPV